MVIYANERKQCVAASILVYRLAEVEVELTRDADERAGRARGRALGVLTREAVVGVDVKDGDAFVDTGGDGDLATVAVAVPVPDSVPELSPCTFTLLSAPAPCSCCLCFCFSLFAFNRTVRTRDANCNVCSVSEILLRPGFTHTTIKVFELPPAVERDVISENWNMQNEA